MSLRSSLKSFWQSVPARLYGSHVNLGGEYVTSLSTKARFPPDELLERRIKVALEKAGTVTVKADRKLVEDQPDGFQRPVNFDELPQ